MGGWLAAIALSAAGVTMLAAAPVLGGQNSGLWTGTLHINAVSDANPSVPDLSFDAGINGLLVEKILVWPTSIWNYDDTAVDRGTSWREVNYDDTAWKTGRGELGYGDGGERTIILSNRVPTTYFRRSFTVADPSAYSGLTFRLLKDDAAVVYLNGAQVRRSNLSSIYTFNTLALSQVDGAGETVFEEFSVPSNLLLSNKNVVAVELHQYTATDPDASFQLQLTATVADPSPVPLVPVQSVWKYEDTGANLGSAWRGRNYDDSAWSGGAAPLGYGNSGRDVTVVSYGVETNKNRTTYFRAAFVVTNLADASDFDIYLLRDDGAVVYINSNEVWRSNMPEALNITYDTPPLTAVTAVDEFKYLLKRVPATGIVVGTNVLAVEVHQHPGELGVGSSVPTPTKAVLDMRAIIHVDSNNTPRLLKEVIQMWKDGTYKTSAGGLKVVDKPGRYVLLTDDALIPDFTGIGMRDGEQVGSRVSAVGFDFDSQTVAMAGSFATGGTVTATFSLPADFRTNPFKHRYHPDHNTGIAVTRALEFDLSSRYPADPAEPETTPPPGWGMTTIGGTYHETLTGLHKRPIKVSGWFEFNRVSMTAVLNE